MKNVAQFSDRALLAMQKAPWGPAQLTAINAFSPDQLDKVGHGVILYGIVWAHAEAEGVLVMALHGTQKPVLVRVGASTTPMDVPVHFGHQLREEGVD